MNRYRMQFAPAVWKPKLNPFLLRWLRPLRIRHQRRTQQLMQASVIGAETVRAALQQGCGVMITPNHSSHADPYAAYLAADEIGTPIYIMATWHVFQEHSRLTRRILQAHGCFSVDREANDIGAFREGLGILQDKPQPLVIFPEGEIYHCNDRVTPFREGAAAMAIAAARRAKRKIVCVPCAISYRYVEDPTASLIEVMGELEQAIHWRRQDQLPLVDRIYRFAEALLVLKELEYFQQARNGPLPERICQLANEILSKVECRQGLPPSNHSIPERVKEIRRTILQRLADQDKPCTPEESQQLYNELDDVFLVVQSFSYPGDYVSQSPTIERMAETIDKFEEDVLHRPTASIRAKRNVQIAFDGPIEVSPDRKAKQLTTTLTQQLEDKVQTMLDQMRTTRVVSGTTQLN
jgi:hypothetical protein